MALVMKWRRWVTKHLRALCCDDSDISDVSLKQTETCRCCQTTRLFLYTTNVWAQPLSLVRYTSDSRKKTHTNTLSIHAVPWGGEIERPAGWCVWCCSGPPRLHKSPPLLQEKWSKCHPPPSMPVCMEECVYMQHVATHRVACAERQLFLE